MDHYYVVEDLCSSNGCIDADPCEYGFEFDSAEQMCIGKWY